MKGKFDSDKKKKVILFVPLLMHVNWLIQLITCFFSSNNWDILVFCVVCTTMYNIDTFMYLLFVSNEYRFFLRLCCSSSFNIYLCSICFQKILFYNTFSQDLLLMYQELITVYNFTLHLTYAVTKEKYYLMDSTMYYWYSV